MSLRPAEDERQQSRRSGLHSRETGRRQGRRCLRGFANLAAAPNSAEDGQRTGEWLLRQRLQPAHNPAVGSQR